MPAKTTAKSETPEKRTAEQPKQAEPKPKKQRDAERVNLWKRMHGQA